MTRPAFDPSHLDVQAFAAAGAELSGSWPLSGMPRVAAEATQPGGEVAWQVRGRLAGRAGAAPEIWIELSADAAVPLKCQRCLQTVRAPLAVRRSFRFVNDEAEAERLDDELDDDVLVIERVFDLHALVEDELLLHLPIVPRHEICPEPLVAQGAELVRDNPFAALAELRKPRFDA